MDLPPDSLFGAPTAILDLALRGRRQTDRCVAGVNSFASRQMLDVVAQYRDVSSNRLQGGADLSVRHFVLRAERVVLIAHQNILRFGNGARHTSGLFGRAPQVTPQ